MSDSIPDGSPASAAAERYRPGPRLADRGGIEILRGSDALLGREVELLQAVGAAVPALRDGAERLARQPVAGLPAVLDILPAGEGVRVVAALGQGVPLAEALLAPPAVPAPAPPARRRRPVLALAAVVLLAALGWLLWRGLPLPGEAWAAPVADTRFAAGSWEADWQQHQPGAFVQTPAGLRSQAAGAALLIHRRRLTLPVVLEYEGTIEPGTQAGDLSVVWSEREDALKDSFAFLEGEARNLRIQAGCFDNTHCGIYDMPGERPLARSLQRLEVGRRYAFRVEIHPDRASMAIDGREVLRSTFDVPLTTGYLALYGYYPGKVFSRAVLRPGRSPATLSPLAVGDALMQLRHFDEAATAYARVAEAHAGQGLGTQALYGKGLAERRDGRLGMSRRTWAGIADPPTARRCRIIELDDLVAEGEFQAVAAAFTELWRQSPPDDRVLLVQRWTSWTGALRQRAAEAAGRDGLERLLALRAELFPQDGITGETAGAALNALGRFAEVAAGFRAFERSWTTAMLSLGRGDEIIDDDGINSFGRLHARWVTGRIERLPGDRFVSAENRATALCRLGRAAEAVETTPNGYPALLYLGRIQQLLDQRPLSGRAANEALVAAGRIEQAAGAGLPDVPGSGGDPWAMLLLGRDADAEARLGRTLPAARLLAALERGGDPAPAIAELEAWLTPMNHLRISGDTWFSWTVLRHWALLRDPPAFRATMRAVATAHRWTFAQRPWHAARHLAGDGPEALKTLPFVVEAEAIGCVLAGIEAELVGDAAGAVGHYRRYAALPSWRRIVGDGYPSWELERFAAWRLRALAAP